MIDMIKIDFTKFVVFTDLAHTKSNTYDIREQIADELYQKGSGIPYHALALKIYNSEGELELSEKEFDLIMKLAEVCFAPYIIDSLKSYNKDKNEGE